MVNSNDSCMRLLKNWKVRIGDHNVTENVEVR